MIVWLKIEQHPERFNMKAATIADEYREIKWEKDESPKRYAIRVLAMMLPKIKSRDEALGALALCYPFISTENALMKIAGALYFTRRDVEGPECRCPIECGGSWIVLKANCPKHGKSEVS